MRENYLGLLTIARSAISQTKISGHSLLVTWSLAEVRADRRPCLNPDGEEPKCPFYIETRIWRPMVSAELPLLRNLMWTFSFIARQFENLFPGSSGCISPGIQMAASQSQKRLHWSVMPR
jgi:hypothetical protein